ncbi:hypothetical protein DPMN_110881 [Dreissena polymorpha]|uniref:MOCS2A n=1 Tax=Dreissena polymorpha TaxID=45954 RepID=A0A9D4KDF3_DREPO|nr:hypothetical protein DPMN_110881 [Dreissena polymorpha]
MGELVKITVLFFAKSRELVGNKSSELEVKSDVRPTDLLQSIISKHNSLQILSGSLLLSINEDYVDINSEEIVSLKSGDTVAVIPPISGG